jgi:hypothetical protein
MSADVLWSTAGTTLTAEQQFARYAFALADTHRAKTIDLDNFTPKTSEPIITVSQGFYNFAAANKNRLIVVASLPLVDNYAQLAGKPWLRVAEFGSEAIPAAFGVV